MGQGASSGREAGDSSVQKRDYYELLGVSLYATDDELKKAYRKKALELHPDRNFGNTEDATRLFAEIQTAYEILSNPQERAWYDSHRDEILNDDSNAPEAHYEFNVRMTTAEDITRMYMSFDGRTKFDDSPNGFFTVLQEFFDRLATEEVLTCERDGVEPPSYPTFGSSDDSFEDVARPFYAAWSSFSTSKSFTWKDKYRLSDAPDRRSRRLMEKENKKARDEGVRDFNGAVRALISFVKRRDPRYSSAAANTGNLHEDLRAKAATQAAKDRAAHQAKTEEYTTPSWARSEETDEEFASEESESGGDEIYECVICNKTFKSESQYEAHEKSKKHRKAIHQVERTMRKENKALGLDTLSEQAQSGDIQDGKDDGTGSNESEPEQQPMEDSAHVESVAAAAKEQPFEAARTEQSAHDGPSRGASPSPSSEIGDPHGNARVQSVEDVSASPTLSASVHGDDEESLSTLLDAQDLEPNNEPKMGKAKLKRVKKEAARAAGTGGPPMDYNCVVCRAGFPSKTQLFKHINETGHAARPSESSKAGKKKKR